jgi:hypothetical protein
VLVHLDSQTSVQACACSGQNRGLIVLGVEVPLPERLSLVLVPGMDAHMIRACATGEHRIHPQFEGFTRHDLARWLAAVPAGKPASAWKHSGRLDPVTARELSGPGSAYQFARASSSRSPTESTGYQEIRLLR